MHFSNRTQCDNEYHHATPCEKPMNIITYPLLQAAAPPKALQVFPQEAPRVDGSALHHQCVLTPAGTHPVQHHTPLHGRFPHGLTPLCGVVVVLNGYVQHHTHTLGVPPPLHAVSRGTRLPPLQVSNCDLYTLYRQTSLIVFCVLCVYM